MDQSGDKSVTSAVIRGGLLASWADANFKSRAAAARAVGVSPQQFNRYLTGEKEPGTPVLERMARAGLNVGRWLVGELPTGAVGESVERYDPFAMSEFLLDNTELVDPREALPQLQRLNKMQGQILDALVESLAKQ